MKKVATTHCVLERPKKTVRGLQPPLPLGQTKVKVYKIVNYTNRFAKKVTYNKLGLAH